ncbi:MAG TPA: hypothetical protein VFU07_05205 [Candidatus Lumbricidophila sp.]|nr:hypothetical protein [Candidatus Lumbricidophila sp.]
MAYKGSYKIPNSLDKSLLDHEIPFGKGGAVKVIPLKVVLFYVGSVMSLFWVISCTFVKTANGGVIFGLIVWWILATIYFGQFSKTKEMKFMGVPALLNYLPKSSRKVMTRSSSNASGFYSITGIKEVEPDGHVKFADGTVGRAYLVVGSASVLVFEQDKQAMVNRVEAFYRKADTTTEFIWITTKEPQRVYRQLANLERKNLALEIREPELFALLDEQTHILTDYVGSRFNSIHQYLVLKSDNEEALRVAEALLHAEVRESSLMIKNCTALGGDEFTEMARALYANAA